MWGFGMMFWLVPLLVFALLSRRGCWAPAGGPFSTLGGRYIVVRSRSANRPNRPRL
jgi:hypothetical protein